MKKTITQNAGLLSTKKTIVALAMAGGILGAKAQVTVTDFETFTLSPNSAYSPTTSTPFQSSSASFQYQYDANFQYWSGGFAYTNAYDSINGTFTNLYGVRAYKGYTNSAIYVVGQDRAIITTTAVPQTTVAGFYMTNTTYAYKSMAKGDGFARKFGDTTGTGSGTTIPQGSFPDYFKVIVKGYNNGVLKNDSVTVMLADFTFTNNAQDYILNTWQFINTALIGEVDSLKFFIRSSDMSFGFINTPTFFALDNFTIGKFDLTGIAQQQNRLEASVYPNPVGTSVNINLSETLQGVSNVKLIDPLGNVIYRQPIVEDKTSIDMEALSRGVYVLEITAGDKKISKKIIKN